MNVKPRNVKVAFMLQQLACSVKLLGTAVTFTRHCGQAFYIYLFYILHFPKSLLPAMVGRHFTFITFTFPSTLSL
jgi:hypothetical protein